MPFDLPKSRLPSFSLPSYARQSCSLGSKRFGTDLSKLYGTTPISSPTPSLFLSQLSFPHLPFVSQSSFSLRPPGNQLPATTSNPRHYPSYKDFFPSRSPPINRILVAVFSSLGRSSSLSLAPPMSSICTLMTRPSTGEATCVCP